MSSTGLFRIAKYLLYLISDKSCDFTADHFFHHGERAVPRARIYARYDTAAQCE
jgi:hypothetical protein